MGRAQRAARLHLALRSNGESRAYPEDRRRLTPSRAFARSMDAYINVFNDLSIYVLSVPDAIVSVTYGGMSLELEHEG